MIETLSVLCGGGATACLLWGYWLYNRGIYSGEIVPNSVTWFLWAIGGAVEMGSYWSITGDPIKRMFPAACATVIVITFLVALVKGRMGKTDRFDILILILDLELGILLFTDFRSEYINAMVQIDLILTFIPLIRSTWKNPLEEDPKPWFIWSLSYILLGITVALRFEDYWVLMYPTTQFALHLVVALIARFRNTT